MKEQTKWETMEDLHSDMKTARRKPARKRFVAVQAKQKKTGDLVDSSGFQSKLRCFMPDFRCKKKTSETSDWWSGAPPMASCCAAWLLCPTRREAKHRVSYTVSSAKKGSSWKKNIRKMWWKGKIILHRNTYERLHPGRLT